MEDDKKINFMLLILNHKFVKTILSYEIKKKSGL